MTEITVDVDLLRSEIEKTYAEVSTDQDKDFIFPTGRAWAEDLAYPQPELSRVPDASVESFAGVANSFSLGRLEPRGTLLALAAVPAPTCWRGRIGRRRHLQWGDRPRSRQVIAGALLEGEHARQVVARGYVAIEQADLVDTYARSKSEDTRRKARKFGAMGSAIRATKAG